ncbi:hypothetical protein D3C81_2179920 [compost metagenome]
MKLTAIAINLVENSHCSRHGKRMVAEGTCHKNSTILILRIGVISETPSTTIDRVHKVGLAGNYTNWKPPANHFSISN